MIEVARYQDFGRDQWAARRTTLPPHLGDADGVDVAAHVARLDLLDVYCPLAELVSGRAELRRGEGPYVVSVVGSVAVGKSTAARALRTVLALEPLGRQVAVVSTDGFLFPNRELAARGLAERKGFPESYDLAALTTFLRDVRRGEPEVHAPLYSHEEYDVTDDTQVVSHPDVLILEGMPLADDGIDLSVYVDAAEADIEQWFVHRFVALCQEALDDDRSFFRHFVGFTQEQSIAFARHVWDTINAVNLHEHILPTRDRSDVILEKGADHSVRRVLLRT